MGASTKLIYENESQVLWDIHQFLIECQANKEINLDSDDLHHILQTDFDYVRKQYQYVKCTKCNSDENICLEHNLCEKCELAEGDNHD